MDISKLIKDLREAWERNRSFIGVSKEDSLGYSHALEQLSDDGGFITALPQALGFLSMIPGQEYRGLYNNLQQAYSAVNYLANYSGHLGFERVTNIGDLWEDDKLVIVDPTSFALLSSEYPNLIVGSGVYSIHATLEFNLERQQSKWEKISPARSIVITQDQVKYGCVYKTK